MSDAKLLDLAWVVLCAGLVFLMQAGFLCLESGLTRTKNNINVAVKNLTDFGFSALIFWVLGYGLMFGSSAGGWVGSSGFLPHVGQGGASLAAFFLFQMMFCGTAVTILSGAIAERMKFGGYVAAACIVAVLVYPLFGHWAWNGIEQGRASGWLARLGFVDFAGSAVVHSLGGWVSLAAVLVIGARRGRFAEKGETQRYIPASNLPLAMLGVFLLWFGWIGFNGGSTLALSESVPRIVANTVLAGAAGLVTALLVSWRKKGRAEADAIINGSLAGLVAITASCHAVTALNSVVIGAIGSLVMLAVSELLERLRIDDAVGAVPVHLGAGIWGTLAVALFGRGEDLGTGLGFGAQLGAQVLGIGVCGLWAFGITWLSFKGLGRLFPLRVSAEEEHIGLNIAEHGASSDLRDLFAAMESQASSGDLSMRAPVEPFTEVGQIAERYNRVMEHTEAAVEELSAIRFALDQNAAILVTDAQGLILEANQVFCDLSGYTSSELVGEDPRILGSRVHPPGFWAEAWSKILTGMPWRAEICNRGKDGHLYWMDATIVAFRNVQGEIAKFISIAFDISARKAAETHVLDSEQRLRLIIDASMDAVVSMSSDGRVTGWSAQAERIFGFRRQEVLGKRMEELIVPEELNEAHQQGLTRYLETGEGPVLGKRIEVPARTKDGSRITVELTITPVKTDAGVWFSAFLRDISDKKRAEADTRRLEEQLIHAQKLESIGQLAAGIAHEINTPTQFVSDNTRFVQDSLANLAPLLECCRRLVEGVARPDLSQPSLDEVRAAASGADLDFVVAEIPKALSECLDGLARVSSIVVAMKQFSHPGTGHKENVDLNRALESTVTVARSEWKYVADLELDLDPTLPPVPCLVGEFNQAVLNMIVNAAHAISDVIAKTPGSSGKIRIATRRADGRARITISDTGGGIPEAIRGRIFDPFFTTKEVGKGTGQGLAIARSVVVDKHGGTLSFECEDGVGTTFIIELPLESPTGEASGELQQAAA